MALETHVYTFYKLKSDSERNTMTIYMEKHQTIRTFARVSQFCDLGFAVVCEKKNILKKTQITNTFYTKIIQHICPNFVMLLQGSLSLSNSFIYFAGLTGYALRIRK